MTDFDALCNRGPGEGPGGNDDGGSDCEDGETTYLTDVDVDIEISPGNTVSCNCNGFFETFNWDGECVTAIASGSCECDGDTTVSLVEVLLLSLQVLKDYKFFKSIYIVCYFGLTFFISLLCFLSP